MDQYGICCERSTTTLMVHGSLEHASLLVVQWYTRCTRSLVVHWFTGSMVHQFTGGALVYQFTGSPVNRFTGAPVYGWCTGAPVHWYTGAPVYRWCTGAPVHWFTGAPVHWFTGGSLVLHCIVHWCIWFSRQRIASRRDCMATFGDGMQQQAFPGLHPGMGTSPASMHRLYIHGVGNYY